MPSIIPDSAGRVEEQESGRLARHCRHRPGEHRAHPIRVLAERLRLAVSSDLARESLEAYSVVVVEIAAPVSVGDL
jgi:hypothetical protein